MTTTEQRLAAALRAVIDTAPGGVRANEADNIAAKRDSILALAAYDAQQAAAPSGWAHEGDTIYRDDGIAIAHCFSEQSTAATIVGEHTAARIVQCVNAHDGLVAALQAALPYVDKVRTMSGGDGDIAAMNAREALAQAGVHHA